MKGARLWRQTGAVLALVALLVTSGTHWVVLQSVAWAGMFVRFAQQDSVAVALEKTFDGQHPCPLCLKVQEGRRTEPRQALMAPSDRGPELALQSVQASWARVRIAFPPAAYSNRFHLDWRSPPQKPPPKAAPSFAHPCLPG